MRSYCLRLIAPFRWWIAGFFFVAIVFAVDLSFRPYILKIMLDNLVADQGVGMLWRLALVYVCMSIAVVLVYRLYDFCWLHFNSRLKSRIGSVLTDRMMDHSNQFFQKHFAGDLASKIKDVMSGLPDLVDQVVQNFISNGLAILIAVVTLWTVHTQFALALSLWVVVFVAGVYCFFWRGSQLSYASARQRSRVVGMIVDVLSNISSVRLFSAKRSEQKHLGGELNEYGVACRKRDRYFMKVFFFQGVSFVLYQSACLYFLISGFSKGWVTVGDFILVLSINMAIINMLWQLSQNIGSLADLVGNIRQGLTLALAPIDIQDKKDAKPLAIKRGEVEFCSVRFNYPDTPPLFEDKSVTIAAGQKVGLVGKSGGGKTTFASLLLRLFEIDGGAIRIDGQEIREVTQDSLRAQISVIPQDPSLFHRSLLENIRYGNPDATDDQVMEAAKRAHAHDFIVSTPQGYDSLVGERGVKLSGGQRQRIAIARAVLKNAAILLLDEATSQLDSVTETSIQQSLSDLMDGKTTIVIAHRLSTLLHMDRILVFDNGRIVEDGTHDELLAKGDHYRQLWDAQVGGFLPT